MLISSIQSCYALSPSKQKDCKNSHFAITLKNRLSPLLITYKTMMKNWLRFLAFILLILGSTSCFVTSITAQTARTGFFMETSKFRHQINPALLEDNPYLVFPFLGNIYASTISSHNTDAFVYKVTDPTTGKKEYDTFMNTEVTPKQFYSRLGTKDLSLDVDLNENIFSIAMNGFGGTNLVEINLRSSSRLELPNQLFHYAKESNDRNAYHLDHLALNHQTYAEIVLGHAHNVGNHFTVGAKVKGLIGVGYADIQADNLDVKQAGLGWSVSGRTRGTLALLNTPPTFNEKGRFDGLEDLSPGITGWGLGADLGVIYEVHGVEGLTVNASLTDLGFINHTKAYALNNDVYRTWSFEGFHNTKDENGKMLQDGVEQFKDDLQELLSLRDGGKTTKKSALKSTLNLGAKYELPFAKHLNVGVLYSKHLEGNFSLDQLTFGAAWHPIAPIELGVSTTLVKNSMNFGAILTVQAPHFQVFVGTDYFSGAFSEDGLFSSRANNINLGVTIPLD